jgi:hypothetical protein
MVILIVFTAVDSDVDAGSQRTRHQGAVQHRERKSLLGFRGNFNGIGRIW